MGLEHNELIAIGNAMRLKDQLIQDNVEKK